jgi:hypothetical protein
MPGLEGVSEKGAIRWVVKPLPVAVGCCNPWAEDVVGWQFKGWGSNQKQAASPARHIFLAGFFDRKLPFTPVCLRWMCACVVSNNAFAVASNNVGKGHCFDC